MQNMVQTKVSLGQTLRRMLATLCVLFLPALAWAAPFAYITNQLDDNVSVIDTATNTVVTTIGVGDFPDGVAVNPAGTRVYVANFGDNTVSVIDMATNTVVGTVPVGQAPRGVVVNPAGTRVYVANWGGDSVSVIDTASNTVTATVPVGSIPWGITINPAGTRVYVADYNDNNVSVIDTASNTVIGAPIPVGNSPLGVAINPAGTRLYVGNSLDGNVSVIDTASNTVIATVTVGTDPYGIVVNPAGSRVYVVNCCDSNVSVINAATNTVIGAPIPVGNLPTGISIDSTGTRVYVVNNGDDSVSIIDTGTNTVVGTVAVGGQPQGFGNFIGPAPAAPAPPSAPADPIPPMDSLPGLPGIGTQPTVLNLGAGKGPAMTACLLDTVRNLLGADAVYLGQDANGIAKISISGNRVVSFYPLQASTNASLSFDIHLGGANVLNIGTRCGNFNIAPALYNLNDFGAVLNGMGLRASIDAQGAITMVSGDTVYVARPDYITHVGTPGTIRTPSLAQGSDGQYRLADSAGSVQVLHPVFVDTDALAGQAQSALAMGGWTTIQIDGSALFSTFSGQQYLLTPDLTLRRATAEQAALLWWQDAPNHFFFRGNTLLMAQGVSARQR